MTPDLKENNGETKQNVTQLIDAVSDSLQGKDNGKISLLFYPHCCLIA